MFSEAAAISDDPRLPRAAADLLDGLRARWSSRERTPARSTRSCARWKRVCCPSIVPEARELAAEAIDALERVVAGAYRPGQGVSHETGAGDFVRGGLSDHVRSASALLTAYMLTARLPYAMLADELMQSVLRTPPEEPDGRDVRLRSTASWRACFAVSRRCTATRSTAGRRSCPSTKTTPRMPARTLAALAPSVRERGVEAAPFGLALAEWLNLQ